MEKKKSKGFFSGLFAPKSNSGCCKIQIEEIFPEENTSAKEKNNPEKNNDKSNESTENNGQSSS